MSDKPNLVVIETRGVKQYIFGTRYLREVRGASLLLDRLNRTETRTLLPPGSGEAFEEIYLGGGSGRVLFAEDKAAREFAGRIADLYGSVAAEVATSVVKRRSGESFSDWMARGVSEAARNHQRQPGSVPLIGGRWVRPCTSCGQTAAQTVRSDVQGTHLLCSACVDRREEIKSFYQWPKHNWSLEEPIPTYPVLKKSRPDTILASLAEAMAARFGEDVRVLLPQDFDHIGARSKPGNYMGFIYADGNQMGKAIRAMARDFKTEDEAKSAYREFSRIVDLATRVSAVEAVIESVELEPAATSRGEPAKLVPAEFVMAGGDDLILVLPAHAALPAARRFVELFQRKTRELQDLRIEQGRLPRHFAADGLTISAGVVLAHASYPASQLLELAKELMKLAKRKAAALAGTRPVGTVDFAVLHESGSESLIARRRREYEEELESDGSYFADFKPGAVRRLRRTERPYTPADLGKLFDHIRALHDAEVPRGKLELLYTSLFQSWIRARFDALRVVERLQATGDLSRHPLQELLSELPHFPFRLAGDEWTTPLSEMIELYDFVPATGKGEAEARNHDRREAIDG